jgi:hypothetical protein
MGTAYNPRIVIDGLVLCLDAGNTKSYPGTGTTWTDLSGNGNNGTLTNGPTFSSSNGGGIVFDGVDDWVSTNFNPNLDNNRLYSYEIWFKDDNAGGFLSNTALISNYGPNATTPYSLLHTNDDGTLRFSERNSAAASQTITSSFSVVDNSWKQIIAVASSSQLLLYINAVSAGTPTTRPGNVITSGQNFVIGGNHLGRYQSCNISLVRIYLDKTLTSQEIQQNFQATRGRYGI